MTAVAIFSESANGNGTQYRAVGGGFQTVGRSAGEALDSLTAQLNPSEAGTVIVIQSFAPDQFFSAADRQRLADLTARWRAARDSGGKFDPGEQSELERLTQAEQEAALRRTEALRRELNA